MTTARNVEKKNVSLCVCVYFFHVSCLKRLHFFIKSSQLPLVGFLYRTFLAHQKPHSLCAPHGTSFSNGSCVQGIYVRMYIHTMYMYVCMSVYTYVRTCIFFTLLSLQNLGVFFSLTSARWESTMRSFHPSVYNHT